MHRRSIKSHLNKYSIYAKRRTTINHAFASAIAPVDLYEDEKIKSALETLKLNSEYLKCFYCNGEAETWDHIYSLVESGGLSGLGHQIGNLLPCCKPCNSRKGKKDGFQFIREYPAKFSPPKELLTLLEKYVRRYSRPIDIEKAKREIPQEWFEYQAIKEEIFALMKKADDLADKIRKVII